MSESAVRVSGDATLLSLEDLTVSYGEVRALRGVSLQLHPGELVGLIGANGAGKTTTLKAVMGAVRPSRGRVRFDSEDIGGLPVHRRVRNGISFVPEGRRLFPSLTVRDNLLLGGFTLDGPRARLMRIDELAEVFPIIADRRNQTAGTLSGGEQQMLAIARGLMVKPRLLLLDEPSMGLAPIVVNEVREMIQSIYQNGTAILMVEQNARLALDICERVYVMELGSVVLDGPVAELRNAEEIKRAYLGQ